MVGFAIIRGMETTHEERAEAAFRAGRNCAQSVVLAFAADFGLDAALAAKVDSGENAVAFAMEPVTVEEMMAIADAGAIMPPKSTWFEPKLRSGLFVHTV